MQATKEGGKPPKDGTIVPKLIDVFSYDKRQIIRRDRGVHKVRMAECFFVCLLACF